jgi:hypothetical protein
MICSHHPAAYQLLFSVSRTYEESLQCIEQYAVGCTSNFKQYGIDVAVEYMKSIVQNKCEKICYESSAEVCLSSFKTSFEYAITLQSIGQLLMELNVDLCK